VLERTGDLAVDVRFFAVTKERGDLAGRMDLARLG
jgi:hypothetical protein